MGEIFPNDPQVLPALLNLHLLLEHPLTNILSQWAVYKINFSSILLSDAKNISLHSKKPNQTTTTNKNNQKTTPKQTNPKPQPSFSLGWGQLFLCGPLTSSNYILVKSQKNSGIRLNCQNVSHVSVFLRNHRPSNYGDMQNMPCRYFFRVQRVWIYVYLTIGGSQSRWKEHFCNVGTHSFYWQPPPLLKQRVALVKLIIVISTLVERVDVNIGTVSWNTPSQLCSWMHISFFYISYVAWFLLLFRNLYACYECPHTEAVAVKWCISDFC